jgi:hypothetical protein
MEQRPLRLGDIVDDYCPRERRITNHAVVVLFEDAIKQTRCTTCDHEHVYKDAKEPRRRKKDATAALYSQVLSGLQKPVPHMVDDEVDEPEIAGEGEPDALEAQAQADESVEQVERVEPEPGDDDEPQPASEDSDVWPMHRRLIRAQLPRTGNEPPPARPIPEFTVRQPGARGSQRQWGRGGAGNGNGNGNHGHGRHRGGQGHGGGNRGRGGFAPPRHEGRGGQGGGRPGGGRGRRSR